MWDTQKYSSVTEKEKIGTRRTVQSGQHETFEELCRPSVLRRGFREVSKNRGSSGIDAITVEDYKAKLEQEIRELSAELKAWSCKPQPVRRVENPKGGRSEISGRLQGVWLCTKLFPIGNSMKNSGSLSIQPETERNLNTCMRSRVRTRTHGSVRGRHPCFRRVPPTRCVAGLREHFGNAVAGKKGKNRAVRRKSDRLQGCCYRYGRMGSSLGSGR